MHDNQHRQTRAPEPADEQVNAASPDELCPAFMIRLQHYLIMEPATRARGLDSSGEASGSGMTAAA